MTVNPLTRRRFLASSAGAATSMALPALATEQLSVVATTGMIADLVARIGGDAVKVDGLMGPGVDPHAYRQTRSDILAMTRADTVVSHGLFLEAQMEDFLGTLSNRVPVFAAAEALGTDLLASHPDYDGKFDPHVWMDVSLWAKIVGPLTEHLSRIAPEHRETFLANASAYRQELASLHAYVTDVTASVPDASRVLVTAHDAFGYFGRAYGFEVAGIQGISTESEAGLARIRDLVDMLVTRRIGAVFVESSVSDRNIRALIEGAAARGHKVIIGGEVFSDAMGEPGTYEGSYLGMLDHNATVISGALGGSVPERGMNGRLKVAV